MQGLGIEESSWWFLQLWMLSEMHVQGSWENDLKTFSSSGSSLNCLLDISSWMPHRYLGVILSPGGQKLSAWHTMKYSKPHADTPEILIRWKNAFQKQKPPLSTWKQFHLWVALSVTSPSSLSSCSSIFSLLIPYRSTSPLHSTAISRESILHSLPTQTALDQSHSVLCSTLLPPDLKPPVVQHKLRLLCLAFKVHPWPLSSFCIICFSSECLLLLPSWPRLIPQTHPGFICPYIWAHIPVHTHLSSSTNPGFDPLSYHWVENLVELTLQDYVVMYV